MQLISCSKDAISPIGREGISRSRIWSKSTWRARNVRAHAIGSRGFDECPQSEFSACGYLDVVLLARGPVVKPRTHPFHLLQGGKG